MHARNCGQHEINSPTRPPDLPARREHPGISRRRRVERQDTTVKVLGERGACGLFQVGAATAARHGGETGEDFCLAHGSREQLIRWLAYDPIRDFPLRFGTHHL